jgi:hypothetical protein
MTDRQLSERQTIVSTLGNAGWTSGPYVDNEWFDEGLFVESEASLVYSNQHGVEFVLHYDAERAVVYLTLTLSDSEEAELIIHFGDAISELMQLVVSFQDQISAQNYRKAIRAIVRLCPETYAVLGDEDEDVVKLTTDAEQEPEDDALELASEDVPLTPEERSRCELFISILANGGWDVENSETSFRANRSPISKPQAEYESTWSRLRLVYHVRDGYVLLDHVDASVTTDTRTRIYPGENLARLLERVIAAQDSLGPNNYSDFLVMLVREFERVALETPAGLVELSL